MSDLLEQVAWAICKASSLPTLEPCEQLCFPCMSASKAACALALEEAAKVAEDCSVKVESTYAAIYIAAAIRDLKDRTDE